MVRHQRVRARRRSQVSNSPGAKAADLCPAQIWSGPDQGIAVMPAMAAFFVAYSAAVSR